jgi:uncharacterized protein (DUF1499 family)
MKRNTAVFAALAACTAFAASLAGPNMHDATSLTPCPDRRNCVSTQATIDRQRMSPIPFSGSAAQAQQQLERVLEAMPRTTIVRRVSGRLDVEFRSRVFGFVDAAEFVIDESTHQIQFRSGARTGYSDFGVNRKRMQRIAAQFAAR